jgi:hypothetical protein
MKAAMFILVLVPLLAAAPVERDEPARISSTSAVRFATVDVRIDPKGKPLAAYQVSIAAPQNTQLVGIEGGDDPAFRDPPYYDPKALQNNGVTLAAFNTGNDLPKASFRAARLHLQISGEQTPTLHVNLMVASDADGKSIANASATVAEGVGQ